MKKILLLTTLLLSSLCITGALAEVPGAELNKTNSIAPMLKKAMPAVVNVLIQGELPKITDPFLKRELQKRNKDGQPALQINGNKFVSLGSGVIINAKKGYIITNAHVVDQAKTILITLNDGRRFFAKLIGADDAYDVALLQIHADNLSALPFAKPDSLEVGDFVAAIGNPFGLSQTVTSGIVSALHRSNLGIEGYENFVQTDAPINMGNSGGALVNMQGQLVGINTALVGPGGGNVGIGFAIPANTIHDISEQLLTYGKVERGLLGVQVQTLTPELADAFGLNSQKGALVTFVSAYSPAEKAGLKNGDVIIEANGTPITTKAQVRNIVGLMRTGKKLEMTIIRNHKKLDLTAEIKTAKDTDIKMRLANLYLYGVTTRDIVADSPSFGYIKGAQVTDVSYDTPAWIAGLQPGDIVISANRQTISNGRDLEAIAQRTSQNGLLLNILRGNGSFFIVIK